MKVTLTRIWKTRKYWVSEALKIITDNATKIIDEDDLRDRIMLASGEVVSFGQMNELIGKARLKGLLMVSSLGKNSSRKLLIFSPYEDIDESQDDGCDVLVAGHRANLFSRATHHSGYVERLHPCFSGNEGEEVESHYK